MNKVCNSVNMSCTLIKQLFGYVNYYAYLSRATKLKIMTTITIERRSEHATHSFDVVNPKRLTSAEVELICLEMNTSALFINGRYYQYN